MFARQATVAIVESLVCFDGEARFLFTADIAFKR